MQWCDNGQRHPINALRGHCSPLARRTCSKTTPSFLRFYSHSQRDGSFTSQWRLSFNCQSWNMSLRQTFKAFLPQIASRPQYPLLFVCVVGGRCCHDGSDTLILALLNWSRDRALASIVAPRNTLYGSGMARAAANCRAP